VAAAGRRRGRGGRSGGPVILLDPPSVPARGRWWSHLVSDSSQAELHAFAAGLGLPRRAFDRDHYDLPAELYDAALAAGAVPVSSRELVARLAASGLRRRPAAVVPRRLRPGDLVRVVAPSGPARPDRVAAGVAVLESWGLRVSLAEGVGTTGPRPYLAADDRRRAVDLAHAWADPEVAGVWATRGGVGAQRLLEELDRHDDLLASMDARRDPPLLVGYSDVTALHRFVGVRLGAASLHGPGVAALAGLDAEAVDRLRAVVMAGEGTRLRGRWLGPPPDEDVSGRLVGGNLAVLGAGVGTPEAGHARGSVVLLEDVREPAYKIDRLLTQLRRSGWLEGARAVVCGAFTDCGDPAAVEAVLADRLAGVPVLVGLPIGHGERNAPVLLGVRARVTPDGRLSAPGPSRPEG